MYKKLKKIGDLYKSVFQLQKGTIPEKIKKTNKAAIRMLYLEHGKPKLERLEKWLEKP